MADRAGLILTPRAEPLLASQEPDRVTNPESDCGEERSEEWRMSPQLPPELAGRVAGRNILDDTSDATNSALGGDYSSWAAFQAANARFLCPRGKTQRNKVSPGFLHQQSASQPHVYAPAASLARVTSARTT